MWNMPLSSGQQLCDQLINNINELIELVDWMSFKYYLITEIVSNINCAGFCVPPYKFIMKTFWYDI